MKKLTLTLSMALSLSGCGMIGGSTSSSDNRTNTVATKTNSAAPTSSTNSSSTTSTTTASLKIETGVAACDEYLTKVETCLNKPNVPEATKTAYRQSLEQNRSAWKQAASTPQGKASLETSCKMAIDSAKPFFDSCK